MFRFLKVEQEGRGEIQEWVTEVNHWYNDKTVYSCIWVLHSIVSVQSTKFSMSLNDSLTVVFILVGPVFHIWISPNITCAILTKFTVLEYNVNDQCNDDSMFRCLSACMQIENSSIDPSSFTSDFTHTKFSTSHRWEAIAPITCIRKGLSLYIATVYT